MVSDYWLPKSMMLYPHKASFSLGSANWSINLWGKTVAATTIIRFMFLFSLSYEAWNRFVAFIVVVLILFPGLVQFTDSSFFSMVGFGKKLRELQIEEWKGYVCLTDTSNYQILKGFIFIYLYLRYIPCI